MVDPKVIIEKGYTLEITSWENDADNYKTKTYSVETLEYAEALLKMCKELFASCNNGEGGIGNMISENHETDIIQYVKKNPAVLGKRELHKDEYICDYIMDLNYSLMGYSEYYTSRVFEKGYIYYSPVDVTVDVITERSRFN